MLAWWSQTSVSLSQDKPGQNLEYLTTTKIRLFNPRLWQNVFIQFFL
jgi:hypothetical protein